MAQDFGKKARFLHPEELGLSTPINTPEELLAATRALNGINPNAPTQRKSPYTSGKPNYKPVR